ncbi:MAG: DUF2339 domain-containing protein [Flammeovirgaceae bacterium]
MEDPRLQQLIDRINELANRQNAINEELKVVKRSLFELRQPHPSETVETAFPPLPKDQKPIDFPTPVKAEAKSQPQNLPPIVWRKKDKTKWEEFIGTNLLNKLGIAILVLGISFGVKYAIDHQMLNPLTRIILGYLASAGLIGFALKLKKDYVAFSAVLLSGGMAALYFITFAAYDFYYFIPQAVAFGVMVAFTAFTVFAALQYNMQVIAIIGLVGAYGVPFLLSDGSGRVAVLLSYMTLVNIGILTISFLRSWRLVFWSAFSLTWLIFSVWAVDSYSSEEHFWLALTFATVFFVIFYVSFLASQSTEQKSLTAGNIIAVLQNCIFYFAWGYYFVSDLPEGKLYLGLFTLFNALIHFGVCVFIYKRLSSKKDSFYFVAGLVLVFLTVAVPVQLEGNWVTLVWASMAALLFWVGRTKKFHVYELLSYPLAALTVFSLLHDWQSIRQNYYSYYSDIPTQYFTPVLNINYFTSLVVAGMFGFMLWWAKKYEQVVDNKWLHTLTPVAKYGWPIAGVVILYIATYQQVAIYFQNEYAQSAVRLPDEGVEYNADWLRFQGLWLIHYSITFFAAIWFVNLKKFQQPTIEWVVLALNGLAVMSFLTVGLSALENLRYSYLSPSRFYSSGFMHLAIRYVSYLFVAASLFVNFRVAGNKSEAIKKSERLFCHLVILSLLSSWLFSIWEVNRVNEGVQLALSILWGVYALYLIVWGFAKDQKHLRIAGIVLFGITVSKLLLIDLREMGTIARTLVLMILGILLLVASFIYNKRKKSEAATEQTIDSLGKED